MPLPEIIIDTIHRQGPLSFRDFMEMALYYPGQGYYTSPGDTTGRSGDFYTSPYLTNLFGEMIAGQLEEMWLALDRQPFTVVECGPGTGLLCVDILKRLQRNTPLFDQLQYILIEKSGWMREKERDLLAAESLLPKVRWETRIEDLPPVTGCILSNELIDNFAVHRVMMEDRLMEIFVDYDGEFKEVLLPAGPALTGYFDQLGVTLPKGFRAEINLEATEWIHQVSSVLKKGFVITIDYGNSSSGLYHDKTGTLICYHRHTINHSPYAFIGEQDITSHVNFSALDHWGRQAGLEYCGYTTQARFLQGLGLNRRLHELETADPHDPPGPHNPHHPPGPPDPHNPLHPHDPHDPAGPTRQALLRQLYTLLVQMGNTFKVLVQRKDIGRPFLSGLQFSQRLV